MKAFFAGNYEAVLSAPERSRLAAPQYVIGAHVFLGGLGEAEVVYAAHAKRLDPEEDAAAVFFLGVGACRISDYSKARTRFGRNLLALAASGKRPSAVSRFYAYQGLAFYRYFFGRYPAAARYAEKARLAAFETGFDYGLTLALDLLGHTHIHLGRVRLGLRNLSDALKLSGKIGNGGIAAAIRISRLVWGSHTGLLEGDCVARLEQALEQLRPEDTYSKAELLLELSRQHLLRGDADRAKRVLDDSCDLIYSNRNKRQAATLNLRYGYLHYLQGDARAALNLVRTAESSLVPGTDRLLLARLRGLQRSIQLELGMPGVPLTGALPDAIHRRILAREGSRAFPAPPRGEDPMGDLIDRAARGERDALEEAVRKGLLGLLPRFLPRAPEGRRLPAETLVLDLVPGSLTAIDRGNVVQIPLPKSSILRGLLVAMGPVWQHKETLVRKTWGYRYSPLRHDPLLYAAIKKLRKALGRYSHWIESEEGAYRLNPRVTLTSASLEPVSRAASAESAPAERAERMSLIPGLNYRQNEIAQYLRKCPKLAVADCARIFDTSKITASRDLSWLARLGLARRVGKGRSTCYVGKL